MGEMNEVESKLFNMPVKNNPFLITKILIFAFICDKLSMRT